MFYGVPYVTFIGNVFVVTIIFLMSGTLLAFLLALPVHAVAYVLSLRDPRQMEVWIHSMVKTPPTRNRRLWGADSYLPGRIDRGRGRWSGATSKGIVR